MTAPVPKDSAPKISVSSIPVSPAPVVARPMGPGHMHAGPVFGYILQGEIENQVEPDPPQIYKAGGYFYEIPMHVHRFLRNRSTTEPASVIVFQEGATGKAAPVIKLLLEEPIPSTANQTVGLLRLTLPAGASSEARAHSGPGVVYVLEGQIDVVGKTYGTGDLFFEPGNQAGRVYRNVSSTETAKLLVYEVSDKPAITAKTLLQTPLGDDPEPKMSMSILNLAAGLTVPTHSHKGAVFAYVLRGDIENQIEPEPPKVFHPGDFFHERPMQVHRLLKSLSKTEPAKILIFQNTGTSPARNKPLLLEPLANTVNQEVSMISMTVPPGATLPAGGQRFTYIVKGEIEGQVDAESPIIYRAGDAFYESPMQAHRPLRNASQAEPAALVVFEVSDRPANAQ